MFKLIKLYVLAGAGVYAWLMMKHGFAFNQNEFFSFLLDWPMTVVQLLKTE